MQTKVKLKTESESSCTDSPAKVTVKKQEKPRVIPAHLAVLLAMKPVEPPEPSPDAKSYFKQKDRLEADPDRSLVGISWDSKDRLVLEFDDGEELVSPPVPVGSITNTSVVVSGGGNSGGGGSSGGVAESFETVNKNLSATDAVLTYDGSGNLTNIAYSNGIIKTLNYTSSLLTSVVLSGSTPSAIELTKSLTYSSGNLSQVTYS